MNTPSFTISTRLSVNGQQFKQTQYVDDRGVVTFILDKVMVFLPQYESNFLADKQTKTLKKIDFSNQIQQVQQTKPLLGSFVTQSSEQLTQIAGYPSKHIVITSAVKSPIQINAEVTYTIIEGLDQTAWPLQVACEQKTRFFDIELLPTELITRINIETIASGTKQNQLVELISLERDKGTPEVEEYFEYALR